MGDNAVLNLLGGLMILAMAGMMCAFTAGMTEGIQHGNQGTVNQCRFSINSCNQVDVEQHGNGNVAAVANGGQATNSSASNEGNQLIVDGFVLVILVAAMFFLLIAAAGLFDGMF